MHGGSLEFTLTVPLKKMYETHLLQVEVCDALWFHSLLQPDLPLPDHPLILHVGLNLTLLNPSYVPHVIREEPYFEKYFITFLEEISIFKVVISVCLFECPIVAHESMKPLTNLPQIFDWETWENLGNVLSLLLKF